MSFSSENPQQEMPGVFYYRPKFCLSLRTQNNSILSQYFPQKIVNVGVYLTIE